VKLIPPPPPTFRGELSVGVVQIKGTLTHGTVSGCVMCSGSTTLYWKLENRFHPLHEGCAYRLVEHWYGMLDSSGDSDGAAVEAVSTTKLTGAYARRAAANAGEAAVTAVVSRAIAPLIPQAVQDNPFWRPGLGPDEPWFTVTETTVGRSHTPCGPDEAYARELLATSRTAGEIEHFLHAGVFTLGAFVVSPDGQIVDEWGRHGEAFGEPLYRPLAQVGGSPDNWGWERCRGKCGAWLWPGRWIVAQTRQCGSCAAADDGGRRWPVEPPALGGRTMPPPPLKKKAAKKDDIPLD
jgi:hypothetical protein